MCRLDDVKPLDLAGVEAFGKALPVNAWLVGGRILVDTRLINATPEIEAAADPWDPEW